MNELERSGVLSHEEVANARDLLEENALLGDYSGEEDDSSSSGGSDSEVQRSASRKGLANQSIPNDPEEVDFGAFKGASAVGNSRDVETQSATGTLRDIERELASQDEIEARGEGEGHSWVFAKSSAKQGRRGSRSRNLSPLSDL